MTRPRRPCPVCGKPPAEDYRPFCSRRCADVDLGRWLAGSYVLPGPPESEEDDETAAMDGSSSDPDQTRS